MKLTFSFIMERETIWKLLIMEQQHTQSRGNNTVNRHSCFLSFNSSNHAPISILVIFLVNKDAKDTSRLSFRRTEGTVLKSVFHRTLLAYWCWGRQTGYPVYLLILYSQLWYFQGGKIRRILKTIPGEGEYLTTAL